MDKLPAELLLSIFENLHFCEMQECMLVCHLWLNAIRPIAIPDTTHITREHTIARLGQSLDSQPSKEAQIKSLVLHSLHLDREVLGSCQEYFPNARSLYLEGNVYSTDLERLGEQNTQRNANLMSWITKIKALEQYGGYPINQCLLAIGTYNALKTLVFRANILNNGFNVDLLVNAPNITRLTLGLYTITLGYLEKIHANLLFLKSLELEVMTLKSWANDKTIIPELVTPSDKVKTLSINTFHDDPNGETETILELLRYIRYKYTNLNEFRFLMDSLRPISNPNEKMIFTNGMSPIIEHIGSKLRLLEIDCSSMLHPLLELMNSSGSQAQCLKLSSACSKLSKCYPFFPDKYSFIRELTLNVNSSKWIPRFSLLMKSIKVLNIKGMKNYQYNRRYAIWLQEILGYCSDSLNSLRIENFDVDGSGSLSQSYALNKLQIHTYQISLSACNFISQCHPHLRYLELGLLEIANGDIIKLDSLSLHRLDLYLPAKKYIKITTNEDNRSRYFCTSNQSVARIRWKVPDHRCIWDTLHQITHEEAREHSDEMICLEFKSVQKLYINYLVAS